MKIKSRQYNSLAKWTGINYTLMMVLFLLITIMAYLFYINVILTLPDIEKFKQKLESVDDKEFAIIKIERYIGRDSKIAILNQNGNVIYTNSMSWYSDYLPTELSAIPDYQDEVHLNITKINECKYKTFKLNFTNVSKENRTLIFSVKINRRNSYVIFKNIFNIIIIAIPFYIITALYFIRRQSRKIKSAIEYFEKIIESPEERKFYNIANDKLPEEILTVSEKLINLLERYENNEWRNHRAYIDRQRLMSEISHDVKTHLTVIHGYAVSLCDNLVPDSDKKHYLNIIRDKSQETSELISKFYEYTKVEHPDFPIELKRKNICELIKQYLAEKYDEIYLNGFMLDIDIPTKNIFCKIDEVLFCRGLENIIVNSMKYNEKGVTIKLSIVEKYNTIKIIIGDDGSGIPEDITDKIFEPFITGNNALNKKHTSGLGLAITEKIMAAHNGNINLKIPPDLGYKTQFEIELPISI